MLVMPIARSAALVDVVRLDRCLDGFDLAEERTDAAEIMVTPCCRRGPFSARPAIDSESAKHAINSASVPMGSPDAIFGTHFCFCTAGDQQGFRREIDGR
jgi:hypothetical protein